MNPELRAEILAQMRQALGLPDAPTQFTREGPWLPGSFPVSEFASAAVAAALESFSHGSPQTVDCRQACAVFRSESLIQTPEGGAFTLWDSVSGDYQARDGWIRIHANYPWHKQAALEVLAAEEERGAVQLKVRDWEARALESAIVASGGCAAAMRDRSEWTALAPGEPLIELSAPAAPPRSLEGLRVLDLTRVIAGPECTRVLAAHGAQVTRIVRPGFQELPVILADFCSDKTSRGLDIDQEREALLDLVRASDVMVVSLRPRALDSRGLTEATIREANPNIVIARLNAYGWHGAWAERRGFDSLVQMSGGIAARRGSAPQPLPAQALDHGAGWLLAAGVARCLALGSLSVRTSLTAMSDFLWKWTLEDAPSSGPDPALREADFQLDSMTGCRRVKIPVAQP